MEKLKIHCNIPFYIYWKNGKSGNDNNAESSNGKYTMYVCMYADMHLLVAQSIYYVYANYMENCLLF